MKGNQLIIAVLIVSLGGFGCSQATSSSGNSSSGGGTTTGTPSEPTSLSTADNGGYTTADEAAYFGLMDMSQLGSDTPVQDPTFAALTADTSPGQQVYLVRIVWGNLELDSGNPNETETNPIDWSGTLSFNGNGELHLMRTILFDLHDHIVNESDPKLVEWVSHTGPHIDGILVELLYTPDSTAETPKLTFATATMTQEISLDQLDHYNQIVTIDQDGHGAAFTGLRTDDDTCLEGFLQGKFHDRTDAAGGIFRGRFVSDHGDLHGFLRGHYGVDSTGANAFFGKYIDATGHFVGLLHGTYGDGAFDGDWTNRAGTTTGTVDGKYVTGTTVDSGFFQGFWEENCVP